MKIQSLLFALITLLFSSTVMAQVKVNPEIQKKFDAFIELSNQKKWDQAFDLMYPKLFLTVPKQDLVDLMTSMEADGLSLKTNNVKIISSTIPYKEGSETFVKLEYMADLAVQVADTGIYSAPKAIQGMTEQFKTAYGENNVKWDDTTRTFIIRTQKSMMAILTGNQWYLVDINNDQKELMEFLFSETVLNTMVRTE